MQCMECGDQFIPVVSEIRCPTCEIIHICNTGKHKKKGNKNYCTICGHEANIHPGDRCFYCDFEIKFSDESRKGILQWYRKDLLTELLPRKRYKEVI